jgi:hypothetical protein
MAAAEELDDDPNLTALRCLELLTYAKAKGEYDAVDGDRDKLKPWKKSKVMDTVERNAFFKLRERRDHLRHSTPTEGCRYCEMEEEDGGG